ncbi:MAG: thiolase family protein [Planctomycetes bacterium]|nr:thiolase family protein [Planctomycetota bacterium]MBT4027932.1 thiolase family protein [Planctomycetota bacterium]MBT4560047.1 thiolase family protein [Planctomycetota bacterium]MBT5102330.1 thiolase family protein [Planctomycetota bacterium]MBT5120581.1 thiolase family protein [Planctomycetota bacterium]
MASPELIVVVSAVRTPIGRFMGGLSTLAAPDLGRAAVAGALEAAKVPADAIDVLYFGQGRQAGSKPNPARQVSWGAGIPEEATSMTVNMACASGMKSIQLAADDLLLGRATYAVAGGMESMSRVPFMLDRMRDGYRLGDGKVVDLMYRDGFLCPLSDQLMGATAETLAEEGSISREAQDAFALESQRKAAEAWAAGRFDDEIISITVPNRRGDILIDRDEHMRPQTTIEGLAKLPTVFRAEGGTVTPGNASGITDGASALVLTTAREAERAGLEPLAVLVDSQTAGTDPARMGLGPIPATLPLLERNGLTLDDFGLIELNEAFAAQAMACLQELPIEAERLNVNGGAIALGHPIGNTGSRIVVTLLHEMKRRKEKRGLATLCVSGGLGMTTAWQLP